MREEGERGGKKLWEENVIIMSEGYSYFWGSF